MNNIKLLQLKHGLSKTDATELYNLINEMRSKNFEYSKYLAKHITINKLGYKYPNISGRVDMEKNGNEWSFDGGFPTKIYAIVCSELGLKNQDSGANVVGFTPHKDL